MQPQASIISGLGKKGYAAVGYIGLGAYFDGQNDAELRLRQSQPVVMRVPAMVSIS